MPDKAGNFEVFINAALSGERLALVKVTCESTVLHLKSIVQEEILFISKEKTYQKKKYGSLDLLLELLL